MKKINRRDYLKHMGIAAAGTIAAEELNLFSPRGGAFAGNPNHQFGIIETSRVSEIATAPQATATDWPWTSVKPGDANPGVRLIFMGMMVFTYKDDEGRVVFHRGADHNLRIVVLENCREIFSYGGGINRVPIKEMELKIKNKPSNAKFYRYSSADFDRKSGDAKDFRWLLDLESSPFHKGKLPRKEGDDKFSSKLKLGHGTVYTYQHTYAKFYAKSNCAAANCKCGVVSCHCNCKDVGHVASIMAADIKPAPGECLLFSIDLDGSNTITLPPLCPSTSLGITYEIYFLNGYQGSSNESDFHMVFDAVEANLTQSFDLELYGSGQDLFPSGLCVKKPPYKRGNKHTRSRGKRSIQSSGKPSIRSLAELLEMMINDEAPCMGGGLGTGGGFP